MCLAGSAYVSVACVLLALPVACSISSEAANLVPTTATEFPDVQTGTTQLSEPIQATVEIQVVELESSTGNSSPETALADESISISATTAALEPTTSDQGVGEAGEITTSTVAAESNRDQPAFNQNSRVSTVGIGDVTFGMTPDLAAERAQTEWVGAAEAGSSCFVVRPDNGPSGVSLWVYQGHIEAVSVQDPTIRTRSGLGLGTTNAELVEAFGEQLAVEAHPVNENWTRATFVPEDENDAAFRVQFDLNEVHQVARYWAGRAELAGLTESEMLELPRC